MATQSLIYPSFAKINLFLHITGKRHDGYHDLQTWFQFIDLKDYLHFTPRQDNEISILSNIKITELYNNLVYKASNALKAFAQNPIGFDIFIEKNIPLGAGLGGGSSNAATTLIALNTLWQCNLSNEMLHAIGVKLGADVPIFLFQKAAWAEGIGELLTEKPYIEQYALIIKPNFHASTAKLFNHPSLNKHKPLLDKNAEIDLSQQENVFLIAISNLYPDVCQELNKLPDANQLKLTGTGACFYLLNPDLDRLLQNKKNLKKDIDSWIVKTLNFAPVER
ncbi:4-(cytidine 5'-diphospho)-2-C-methyl-D-erythritol kinase [Fastidiosibacter lacustris]|uniref:4-(cytidine 5'-diphospho)-2-C-methyl-D-erythritol kinase n=1 Tax=Fastidiosibacter lacustris TaxID=2056695 RepID=UPI000E3477E5|nr:4-(cytidine 5'-diphospho)-2-C-methyl-D-erythritol kinase [Fastidiosibacter lacustris]